MNRALLLGSFADVLRDPRGGSRGRHLSLADEREGAACVDDSTDGRDPPWCAALDALGRDRAPAGWGAPLLTSSAPTARSSRRRGRSPGPARGTSSAAMRAAWAWRRAGTPASRAMYVQHGVQADAAGQRIVVPPPRLMKLRVGAGSIVRAARVRTRAGLLPLRIVLRPGLHDRPRDASSPSTGLPSCGLSPHWILVVPDRFEESSVFASGKLSTTSQPGESRTMMKVLYWRA